MERHLLTAMQDFASEEMKIPLMMFTFYSLISFVAGFFTGNVSQVDKLWSIVPVTYIWYYAYISNGDPRILLMAFVTSLWGIRLTFNFIRRGGYDWPPWRGEEDYRWKYVREFEILNAAKNPIRWEVFNFCFIAFAQHFLLMAIALPAHIAYKHRDIALSYTDCFFSILFLFLVLFEATADEQQYEFQTEKHRKKNARLKLNPMERDGFCSSGLWSLCRHPNYFAEQALWITIYLFSVPLEGQNWSMLGFISLMILFMPSTWLSENITSNKYNAYAEYKKKKPKFLPIYGSKYTPTG